MIVSNNRTYHPGLDYSMIITGCMENPERQNGWNRWNQQKLEN